MDEDNLTRVEADAEDRVRLVAQRPAPAVEEIGLHRFTLPFRSPTRPRGPFRNRGRRAAGDESGRRASRAERRRETGILRAGGPAEAFPLPLSMTCQPKACRRPMCAPGFVAAPTLGPVRGSAPAGWKGAAGHGAAGHGAADGPRGTRPPANYLLSSVVSFSTRRSTRRSMSSSTVPVLGRPRLPASSDSSFLVRLS